MGIEQNKDTVLRFLSSLAGDPDYSLTCDDMKWWMPGIGAVDRAGFEALMVRVRSIMATPVTLEITNVTAEDDRVALECAGHAVLRNGAHYDNRYHFLYLLRDGKLAEQREYADTAYAQALLGPLFEEDATAAAR